MSTTNYNFKRMDEDEKILAMVELLGANSPETAVTMEQIIAKGIETGATGDYFRENWHGYKEGDHPWWQEVAPMMGVGTIEEVRAHDCPHLHRRQVKEMKGDRKTNVMRYWIDESMTHKQVIRQKKVKKNAPLPEVKGLPTRFVGEAAEQKAKTNPDYVVIRGKLMSRSFILAHPERFDAVELAIARQ
jgi:hypothetical protein